MNYKRFIYQFPKWGIALGIFSISTALFSFWWFFRKPNVDSTPSITSAPHSDESSPASKPLPALDFSSNTYLIGGRNLYEFRDRNLELIRKDWLPSSLGQFDQPIFINEPKVLVVGNANNDIAVFQEDGTAIGKLSLSSGDSFDGYVSDDLSTAVFVKEGNLWRGYIDWPTAKVVNEVQATTLGYIQGNPLKGRLIAASEKGVVYRDPRFGNVGINLETGASQNLQFPANIVPSPNGSLIVGDTPTRPAQVVVFDVNTLEYTTHPIPWRIQQNGLAWLSNTRFALILNDQIQLYDHETQSLSKLYQGESTQNRLALVALPAPDYPFLMFQDPTKGIVSLNIHTLEERIVTGPPTNHIQMLKNGYFILSSDVANSEQRGAWLGSFKDEALTRIFAQPLLSQFESNRGAELRWIDIPEEQSVLIRALEQWQLVDLSSEKIAEVVIPDATLAPIRVLY